MRGNAARFSVTEFQRELWVPLSGSFYPIKGDRGEFGTEGFKLKPAALYRPNTIQSKTLALNSLLYDSLCKGKYKYRSSVMCRLQLAPLVLQAV